MAFVKIYTFDNYIDAQLRLAQLQSEDINCWLQDENTVTIDPIISNAIGGIKLMVHESQKEQAQELLRTMMNKEKENRACPKCHSLNVEYIVTNRKPTNWLSAIFGYVLGGYAMGIKKVYHCFNCGHEFDLEDNVQDDLQNEPQ